MTDDCSDILNWRRIDNHISTSGQPSESELADIEHLGVRHVINLGPITNKGALADEAGTVAALGMEYTYIPVDFENPTQADFEQFRAAMERLQGESVHVHCIYNARVSAFFYRLACEDEGEDPQQAFERMESIWRPGGVWAEFIAKPGDIGEPNRYAGYDY